MTHNARFNLRIALGLILIGGCCRPLIAAEGPDAAGIEFFEKRIRPVLVKQCYSCHSAKSKKLEGKLRLDTREEMLTGGESGPAVVPKNPKESLLIEAIRYESLEMPPEKKLPDDAIADFEKWVAMGAPVPASAVSDSGHTGEYAGPAAAGRLWSLRPMGTPDPPNVAATDWPRTGIDLFILHRLESEGLKPVADAPLEALLRRICFDVIGLPPSPEEIDAFQKSAARDPQAAIAEVIDRLLASPAFGERWGRHWLDVARYAESNGKSRDVLMPHAWRYRDYVYDAFNADIPYDDFITEQIAGDLLPAESDSHRDRLRIATGFLAIGSKPLVGGNLELDVVDDQIDVVGKAMIGLTVSCARCHDHKFDPIPTADYYALAGIFRSTETLYGGGLRRAKGNDLAGKAKTLLVLGGDADQMVKQYTERQKSLAQLNKQRQTLAKKLANVERRLPKNWKQRLEELKAARKAANPASDNGGPANDDNGLARTDSETDGQEERKQQSDADKRVADYAALQDELRGVQEKLKALSAEKPPELDFAIGVRDAAKKADSPIYIRGERNRAGDVVPRGFLSCITLKDAPKVDTGQSGRLQLARWLTHPEHPLTARVAVNRIWLHLFGRGIVASVDNFGSNGEKPSHPELLDYLARRFIEGGWSTKSLVREIVLSRTYQLSSEFDEANYAADPENVLYWRMSRRRLEAEPLRDAMLAASGQLQLARPEASAVARIGEGEVGRGINTAPLYEAFPHRSAYLPIIRGIVPEVLKTFDFPEPSNPQGRRDTTNVPPQSLFLMNSPFVIEQSAALAARVLAATADNQERLNLVYKLCFARSPDESEIARGVAFLKQCDARLVKSKPDRTEREAACWSTYCQALLASAEFRYLD